MKKLLEVTQYDDIDMRFNTDLNVQKDPYACMQIALQAAITMATKLWGGNEMSVMAVIRALAIADLAISVNRQQMIKMLADSADEVAKMLEEMKETAEQCGLKVQTFAPGTKKPFTKS